MNDPLPTAIEATVKEALPMHLFRLETRDGALLTAGPSPEAKRLGLYLRPGQRVWVRRTARDPNRGVILGLAEQGSHREPG